MRGWGILFVIGLLVLFTIGSYLWKRGQVITPLGGTPVRTLSYDWSKIGDRGLFALHGLLYWVDQNYIGRGGIQLVIENKP